MTEEKQRKEKKTNYQRLWRGAVKREKANYNLANAVIQSARTFIKDKKDLATFEQQLEFYKSMAKQSVLE